MRGAPWTTATDSLADRVEDLRPARLELLRREIGLVVLGGRDDGQDHSGETEKHIAQPHHSSAFVAGIMRTSNTAAEVPSGAWNRTVTFSLPLVTSRRDRVLRVQQLRGMVLGGLGRDLHAVHQDVERPLPAFGAQVGEGDHHGPVGEHLHLVAEPAAARLADLAAFVVPVARGFSPVPMRDLVLGVVDVHPIEGAGGDLLAPPLECYGIGFRLVPLRRRGQLPVDGVARVGGPVERDQGDVARLAEPFGAEGQRLARDRLHGGQQRRRARPRRASARPPARPAAAVARSDRSATASAALRVRGRRRARPGRRGAPLCRVVGSASMRRLIGSRTSHAVAVCHSRSTVDVRARLGRRPPAAGRSRHRRCRPAPTPGGAPSARAAPASRRVNVSARRVLVREARLLPDASGPSPSRSAPRR